MNRKVLTGIGISLLVLASLVLVAGAAFRAGDRHDGDAVRELVVGDDTARTIVVDGGWRGGPGFGFLLFPLVIGGLILLFASRRGPRFGPPWRDRDDDLRSWHRRVHAEEPSLVSPAPPTPPAPSAPPTDVPGSGA